MPRRFTRPPPPRITLEGVVVDVIDAESGAPIIVVAIGSDGAEIECRPSRERFYAEDLKHLTTGSGCEITGGDGGDWVLTRLLADADASHITTLIETGGGLVTIADDRVSIAHADGADTGLFSSGAGITRIAHADENTEAALAISPDGISLWGPDAGIYTAQAGTPGARVDLPIAGTAMNVAPDNGTLIVGRVDEGGAPQNSLPAYGIPMMKPGVTASRRQQIALPESMPDRVNVTGPGGLTVGSFATSDLFPGGYAGRLHLSELFEDITRRLLVSGSVGNRAPATVNPTPIPAPANFRIRLAPAPLSPRAEAAIAYDSSWRAPAGFQAGVSGNTYRIVRESINTVTAPEAPTDTIVADFITLPSAAPRQPFHATIVQGLEHVIRGTGEVPVIAAAIPASVPPAGVDGAHRAIRYTSGVAGAVVYSNRDIGSDPAYAAVVMSQPGDALASVISIVRSGPILVLTPTLNYAAFLTALGARVVDTRGNPVAFGAAQISASRYEAYTVHARRQGLNIRSAKSGEVRITTVVLASGFQFAPAP